jgi:hypothetical protein
MPRPDSIPPAKIAEWTRNFRASEFAATPFYEEFYLAGCWLYGELLRAGATIGEANDLGFAAGQHSAFKTDPWPVFEGALDKWKRGCPDRPGPELANRLFRETFER